MAYAIGRKALTVPMVIIFAVAETISLGIMYWQKVALPILIQKSDFLNKTDYLCKARDWCDWFFLCWREKRKACQWKSENAISRSRLKLRHNRNCHAKGACRKRYN